MMSFVEGKGWIRAHKIKNSKKLEIVKKFYKIFNNFAILSVEKWFAPFWNLHPTV